MKAYLDFLSAAMATVASLVVIGGLVVIGVLVYKIIKPE